MAAVVTALSAAVLQPTSIAARLANASARATMGSLFMILCPSSCRSVENEAVLAVIDRRARRPPGVRRAVDLVQPSEQDGGRIGRIRKAVIRTRQVLLRHRACDIGRHD